MPIKVLCKCGKQYNVAERLQGKKFQCKKCGTVVTIKRSASKSQPASVQGDDDTDFMGLDLDSEYSNFDAVEQPRSAPTAVPEATNQLLDPTGPPLDLSQRVAQREMEGMGAAPDGVEVTAKIIGGVLGILLGIGLMVGAFLLRANLGIGNRATLVIFGAGIASFLGGLGWMVGSGGNISSDD